MFFKVVRWFVVKHRVQEVGFRMCRRDLVVAALARESLIEREALNLLRPSRISKSTVPLNLRLMNPKLP